MKGPKAKKPNWSLVVSAKESGGGIAPQRLEKIVAGGNLDDEIAALARRGYHFEKTPDGGLEITGWPRRLFAEEIAYGLSTSVVGRRVEVHWVVSSTNDLARAESARGREGAAIFAEEQTTGRGRFGRTWRAPKYSSLLLSVALACPGADVEAEGVMLAGAVAVAEAICETTALTAEIRWPNDVLVEGKKVSGILVEGLAPASGQRWLVVGAGVNVNVEEEEFPAQIRDTAGSLSRFAGRRVDRALLARAVLRRLDFWWEILRAGQIGRVSDAWRAKSSILGTFITVESAGGRHTGRVVDLDHHFGLVLQLAGGPTRVFAPGETTLID